MLSLELAELIAKLGVFFVGSVGIFKVYEHTGLGGMINNIVGTEVIGTGTSVIAQRKRRAPNKLQIGKGIVTLSDSKYTFDIFNPGDYHSDHPDLVQYGYKNDSLDRIRVHDNRYQVELYVDSPTKGANAIIWHQDGEVSLSKSGNNDWDLQDKVSFIRIVPKQRNRVTIWTNYEKDYFHYCWTSNGDRSITGGMLPNDKIRMIRVEGDRDLEVFENGNFNGLAFLVTRNTGYVKMSDHRHRGRAFPENSISSMRLSNHERYVVMYFDRDPVGTRTQILTKKGYFNPIHNDRMHWIYSYKGSVELFDHGGNTGTKLTVKPGKTDLYAIGWHHRISSGKVL